MSFNNPFASAKKPANSNDNPILDNTDDEVFAENVTDDDSPVFRRAPAVQQSSSLPTSQPTKGLPTTAGASAPRNISGAGANNMFSALMDDDDDEEGIPLVRKNSEINPNGGHTLSGEDAIIKAISEKQKELRKKYPTGGIKTSRFVTADILLKAPEKYFEKYYNEVSEGVKYVRNHLTEGGRSEIIRDAQDHPTDDAYQDEAYFVVSSLASEFMQRSMWRDTHKAIILSFICNEIVGFGRLDPLWRDSKITEIVCNGPKDIQVEIKGEIYKVESISFDSQAHIMELIERLYRAIGKNPSQTNPLLIGRLHDRSRIFVTHPSVNPDGPNFTIRRHPKGYWIPEALVERGAASEELMSYIGNIVYKGGSLILSGGTHSGKLLALDTIVHTPDGNMPIGDIMPGQRVFDHHGNIANVTDIFPQPPQQVYAVKFANKQISYAGADHNWFVSTHKSRKSNKYRESHKKNKGWERKTKYSPEVIENIKKLIEDNSSNVSHVTLAELSELIGRKIYNGSTIHKLLKEGALAEEGNSNLFILGSALNILLGYSQDNINDHRHLRAPLFSVMTTKEIMDAGIWLHSGKKKRYQFHIPVLENPVQYDNALSPDELPIHPYLFGLWLGDGNSRGAKITSAFEDRNAYLELFKTLGIDSDLTPIGKSNKEWKITYPNFKNLLSDLGVLQRTTEEGPQKRIPDVYKYATEESRRLLIAGMIDSDGWVDSRVPGWVFTNTNEELIQGFIQVASSLAYKVDRGTPKNKTYTYKGEKRIGKTSWNVSITTHDHLGLLPRKIQQHRELVAKIGESLGRQDDLAIVDIYPVPGRIEEMKCISVDSPDNTYMIEDTFITTHNTSMLNALTGFYKPKVRILTIESNLEMKPNPKKLLGAPMECRDPAPDRPGDRGVTMRDLVKATMQMRPDTIVVGEVTDDAAYDLCQALNTGHAGASTVHANGPSQTVTRLTSLIAQGGLVTTEGALDLIASAFDIIISVKHFPVDGSRRIVSVDEIGTVPIEVDGRLTLPTHQLWRFVDEGLDENGKVTGFWEQVGDISDQRKENKNLNLEADLTWDELKELSSLPADKERA